MNSLQLLRALGLEHPTPADLARADACIAELWHAAADLIVAADLSAPAGTDPTSYARRRAAFLLRRAVPPSQRLQSHR